LFGDPKRQSPDELQNLIRLKKMLNEAADVRRRHNRPGLANRHARAHDIRLSVLPVR